MKTQKHFMKILSVFLVLLTFVNCEKADTSLVPKSVNDEASDLLDKRNSTSIRTVSFKEIPTVASKIQTLIGKEPFTSKKSKIPSIIDTKNILEVTDSLNNKNYSFGMLVKENEYKGPRLYNLIVSIDSSGRMSDPKILRFKPKNGYEEEWLENDLDLGHFTGSVSLLNYTAFFNNNPLTAAGEDLCPPEFDEYGDPIVCINNDISGGSGGGGASEEGAFVPAGGETSPDNGGGGGTCSFNYYWNYCGGTNENIAHNSSICGGNGSGAGWVLEISCPVNTTNYYFMATARTSECPSCASGPSGDLAVNTYVKEVTKLQMSLGNNGYDLSYSELTWLNLNDEVAYDLMQPIKNDSWSSETINTSLLNLFKGMANDGWVPKSGTVGNRAALKYTYYYEPNLGESMYLLKDGFVLYQSQTERRINENLNGTIASTEPPTNGYNYIYSPETDKWYEYSMPPEDYSETDLNFLFDRFWDGAKFVGRYVLPVEDVIILIDGKDFDGVEQSQLMAGGMIIVSIIPGGKIGKAIKPVTQVVESTKVWGAIAKAGNKTISFGLKASGEAFDLLSAARARSGTAFGSGVEINGKWLKGTEGNAGFFPKRIADKMRNKVYPNFDQFRSDFWKNIANDVELASQFDAANITRMKNGYAPVALESQHAGKVKSYQLHHKTPLNQGGTVYDVDNLFIVTPKYHKSILSPTYHYGYKY